jgi:NAD(P)-dependent dehydrogenase (short-subunit alcohol dehydrogenase family)
MLARIPAGHFALPGDVASAVLYLASPGAEMVNGTDLVLDGGYLAT